MRRSERNTRPCARTVVPEDSVVCQGMTGESGETQAPPFSFFPISRLDLA